MIRTSLPAGLRPETVALLTNDRDMEVVPLTTEEEALLRAWFAQPPAVAPEPRPWRIPWNHGSDIVVPSAIRARAEAELNRLIALLDPDHPRHLHHIEACTEGAWSWAHRLTRETPTPPRTGNLLDRVMVDGWARMEARHGQR